MVKMMKILWIVNTPIDKLGEALYGQKGNGLWMAALLNDFKNNEKYQLSVVTTAAIPNIIKIQDSGIDYYALPSQVPILYDENKPNNIKAWRELLNKVKPDLIQIWGTEFTHGLAALREAGNIPSAIYMQGLLASIGRHYTAGISYQELKTTVTLRDRLKHDSILQQQQKYLRNAAKEKEMFCLSGRIICENEWCNMSVHAISPEVKCYYCPLSVNRVFTLKQWNIEKAEKHSIICTASGYPLKGLHMILRAVAKLKEKYPDIKLYVPGPKMVSDGSFQWKIRKRGYTKYIEQLIEKLGIEDQIEWMGQMTQDQLAEQYARTRVFVLSSSIENHSSSLKEAMMVGIPSIAAAVGGVPEYVRHGENAFLYRFEEYDVMAGYIEMLFENNELSEKLSVNGRHDMMSLHKSNDIYKIITGIYDEISAE